MTDPMSTPGPSSNGTHRQSNDNLKGSMFSRIATVFVVMVMAASCLVLVNGSDDSFASYGPVGGGVEYFLDEDGELTFSFTSGTGITNNYSADNSNRPPWWSERLSVKKVTVHAGVVGLGNYLLAFLTNLETVQIGAVDNPNLTTIGDYCFRGDTKLTSITTFDGSKKLPSKVTTIGDYAFRDCSSLSELALPAGLTALGMGAFTESGITTITLPNGITTVPSYCFRECKSLNSVVLANSTTAISDYAFLNCSALRTMDIMDTVASIGTMALGGCSSLQSIHMSTALTSVDTTAFAGSKLYDYDMEAISVSADNLKGKDFQRINDYYAQISDSLMHDGNDFSITDDMTSTLVVKASSIAYVVDKANSEASTTFRVNLMDGRSAYFDCNAIKTFITETATLSISEAHPESIDEKTKELVGNQPVYNIYFGDNENFGDGRMTITLPYTLPEGESADNLKVYCISGGEIIEKYDCTYADGKVTFTTSHLSTYSFGFESSSGGKFPVWAIVLIVIVLLAAAGGVAAFFIIKNRKDGSSSDASGPAAPVVNDAAPAEETKEAMAEEPLAPAEEPVEEAPTEETIPVPVAEPVIEEPPASPVEAAHPEPRESETVAEPEPVEEKAEAPKEEPAPASEPVVEEAPAAPVTEAHPKPTEEKIPTETPATAEEPVAEAPAEDVPAPEINKESEPSPEKEGPAPATEEKPRKRRPVSNMDDDDLDPSGSEDW